MIAVAESARNVACTGAIPLAITNCLNFGNPYKRKCTGNSRKQSQGSVRRAGSSTHLSRGERKLL